MQFFPRSLLSEAGAVVVSSYLVTQGTNHHLYIFSYLSVWWRCAVPCHSIAGIVPQQGQIAVPIAAPLGAPAPVTGFVAASFHQTASALVQLSLLTSLLKVSPPSR